MKKLLLSSTAALAMMTSAAFSETVSEQLIRLLQEDNYDSIEIKNGPTQIKVEAIRDGMKLEAIYDALTGELLISEVEPVGDDDDNAEGVRVSDEDDDFIDEDESDDDENDDDEEEDDDENDDEENDDDDDEDDDDEEDDDDDEEDDDEEDDDRDDDEGDDD